MPEPISSHKEEQPRTPEHNSPASGHVIAESIYVIQPQEQVESSTETPTKPMDSKMTDTVMHVAPTPYAAPAHGYGYGNTGRDCLSEVVLANQISSGFSDAVAATHTSSESVSNTVTQHGLRNNDAINSNGRCIEKSIADLRVEVHAGDCETQKLLLEKFGSLQNQITRQHCEIQAEFLRQTNEQLKAQLLDAKLAALHPAA